MMTDNQKVIIQLLSEIDEICRKRGWNYFLGDRHILEAVRVGGFETESVRFSIWMPAEDFVKFAEINQDELPKNRYLESLLNNPNYPQINMRYGSSETSDIDLKNYGLFTHHGINIEIVPLRPDDSNRYMRTARRQAENAWETYANYLRAGKRRESAYNKMKKLCAVLGRERTARLIFRLGTAPNRKTDKDKYYYKKYWQTGLKYKERSFFEESRDVEYETLTVKVPADTENYLVEEFGDNWRDFEDRRNLESPVFRITDCRIPYEKLMQEAIVEGVDPEESWNKIQKFVAISRRLNLLRRKRNKTWNDLFLSGDRYYCWSIYKDKKEHLRELKKEGRAQEILEELGTYIDLMEKNIDKRLGLCFDKEIFEMLEYAYKATGNDYRCRWIARVRENVPEEHWLPIKLKDYKGHIIYEED